MISFDDAFAVIMHGPELIERAENLNHRPSRGQTRFDLGAARQAAADGKNWHDNMVRAVAHLVATGAPDSAIQAEIQDWRLPGYTPEDTAREVQVAIDGARAKGFDRKLSPQRSPRPPFLQRACDIPLSGPKYLVEDMIEENTLTQIFGVPGSGKSFLAIDLACAISCGRDYHGKATRKGLVVYVAGEGRRGASRRIYAYARSKDIDISELDLYVSRTSVGLNSGANLDDLKSELHALADTYGSPKLIVIDTVARNFGDGDENDTRDMTRFVNAVDALNDEFQCATVLVHHSGHADKDRARGSSALKGALDAEFKVSKSEDSIYLECTKMKDQDYPERMAFYFIPAEIGKDENGEPISSAYLEHRGSMSLISSRLTRGEAYAISTLRQAWEAQGGTALGHLNPMTVTLEQWREAYYRGATQDKVDSKRKAFERSRQSLRHKGWITVDNDVYTFTPRTYGQKADIEDYVQTSPVEQDPDGQDTPL